MSRPRCQCAGLTLVEVLLSMAIMAMVLAALAQLQDSGTRAAHRATLTSEASVLCQSEIDAWLINNSSTKATGELEPIAGAVNWTRRITVQPAPTPDAARLSLVTVEVYRGQQPLPLFAISRWVPARGSGVRP